MDRFIIKEKPKTIREETIETLYQNGRDDLINIYISITNTTKMNDDIDELNSILAKSGKPHLIKVITDTVIP